MPKISDALLALYKATHFQVFVPGGVLSLHIDEYSAPLLELHAKFGVASSAFITAYNPRSHQTPDDVNAAAQEALITEVKKLGLPWIAGAGVDPLGQWPLEPSLLVLGISRTQSLILARQFGQNACVFIGASGIPELLLTCAASVD